jgi:hypothetical protein
MEPEPYLVQMDLDPGGSKTYGTASVVRTATLENFHNTRPVSMEVLA